MAEKTSQILKKFLTRKKVMETCCIKARKPFVNDETIQTHLKDDTTSRFL